MESKVVVFFRCSFDCSNTSMFPKIGVPKMDGENNGKPY